MMTIDETWVKAADDALKKSNIVVNDSYLSCYRGYISTFGTAIVQSGLVAASVFYELKEKNSKGNRYAVIWAIIKLLVTLHKIKVNRKEEWLLSYYVLTHQDEKHQLGLWVDKAVGYLKFALRQYKEIEEDANNRESHDFCSMNQVEAPAIFGKETSEEMSKDAFNNKFLKIDNNKHANIGWLFYRDFYKDFTYDKHTIYIESKDRNRIGQKQGTEQQLNFRKRTMNICKSSLTDNAKNGNIALLSALPGVEFKLQTLYPGMLIGSGLNHSSGEKNDVKIGFLFDYTTGLPYIPGSSIKGVLRSMFPMQKNNSKKENGFQYNEERTAYINSILNHEYTTKQLQLLALDIFEKDIHEGTDEGHRRDVFFDALITRSGNDYQNIIGDDFITPHESPIKNPNPIQFIKVLPRVEFTFKFWLHDTCLSDGTTFTVAQKIHLFKQILKDVGVGAKTHVGYGRLDEP